MPAGWPDLEVDAQFLSGEAESGGSKPRQLFSMRCIPGDVVVVDHRAVPGLRWERSSGLAAGADRHVHVSSCGPQPLMHAVPLEAGSVVVPHQGLYTCSNIVSHTDPSSPRVRVLSPASRQRSWPLTSGGESSSSPHGAGLWSSLWHLDPEVDVLVVCVMPDS